jgi:hypothetical protein
MKKDTSGQKEWRSALGLPPRRKVTREQVESAFEEQLAAIHNPRNGGEKKQYRALATARARAHRWLNREARSPSSPPRKRSPEPKPPTTTRDGWYPATKAQARKAFKEFTDAIGAGTATRELGLRSQAALKFLRDAIPGDIEEMRRKFPHMKITGGLRGPMTIEIRRRLKKTK